MMGGKGLISVVSSALLFFAPGLARVPQATVTTTVFSAATARVEITPNTIGFPDYYRSGYRAEQPVHITSGNPLYATGLVLSDSTGQQWITVTIDVLAVPATLTAQIQTYAQTNFGIPPERVLLVGSHTHSGPVLVDQPNLFVMYGTAAGSPDETRIKNYSDAFVAKVDSLISTLAGAPEEPVSATAAYGLAKLSFERSSARPTITDHRVPVLTLRSTVTQKIVAVVFQYATHAVSLGPINSWDGDYPRATANSVEQQLNGANPGVRALYVPGASGDQNPLAGQTPASMAAALTPQIIGATNAAAGTGAIPVLEPQAAGAQDVTLPLDIRVSDATLRAHYAAVAADPTADTDDIRHAQVMVQQIDAGTLRRAMVSRVTVWRFGAPAGVKPLAWISIAGEPTMDFTAGFENLLGDQYRLWTFGYTNGHPGYLPSDELLNRGDGCPTTAGGCFYRSYEAGWDSVVGGQRYPSDTSITYNDGLPAPLAPGADNTVCQSATTLLLGTAADCTAFTPGRLLPHPALANIGASVAQWTDSAGRTHVEVLVLGTDSCLHHRTWIGDGNGGGTGVWTAWDPMNVCGGIVGPSSAGAWVDSAGNAHIEITVRTSDSALYHGRCAGDATGCFNHAWQWTQIAAPGTGFTGAPQLSVWKQLDGTPRLDAFAVNGSGACLLHRGWVGSDTLGNGSWVGNWTSPPGCGGIYSPAGSASWRDSAGTVRHDVFAVTTNGSIFTIRCTGSDATCSWGGWVQLSVPSGTTLGSGPSFSATPTAGGMRFDVYVKGSDSCIWNAAWTTTNVPTTLPWRKLPGCGLVSRPAAVDWQDNFGRGRSTLFALDTGSRGPLWVREIFGAANPANDLVTDWQDIADPTASVTGV
jgi:hypothetical protein